MLIDISVNCEHENQITLDLDLDDLGVAKGVFNAIWHLYRLQKEFDKKHGKLSGREYYVECTRIENLMRETIDGALGTSVCEQLLGAYPPGSRTRTESAFGSTLCSVLRSSFLFVERLNDTGICLWPNIRMNVCGKCGNPGRRCEHGYKQKRRFCCNHCEYGHIEGG